MDQRGDGQADHRPHLKDYVQVVSARRWTLISTVVVVVLAATVWVLVQTPIYRAEALVLIEPAKVNLTEFKGVDPATMEMGSQLSRREFFETQCKLIVCRPILEKTFSEFMFGDLRAYRDAEDPIVGFGKHFAVNPVRRSRLVSVTFDWPDPEMAARALDYLVTEYIADYRRRAVGVTQGGLDALREKAEQLRPLVEDKADTLQHFMVANNMVSLEKTQNIIVDRLKELNRSLSEVERQKIEFESICANIQRALDRKQPPEDMPEVADSRTISDLKLEYIRTKQECSDLAERFGPNHPEVVAARARLATIAEKMQQEIASVLAAARAQLDRATKQVNDLRRELTEQEQRVMRFNKLAVRYNTLRTDYETSRKTYGAIAKRIEEIEITMAAGSKNDNIFVITPPRVPVHPARPRKELTVAVAAFLGLGLGLVLCFFVAYLDTTIKNKEDVERILGVPTLGYVPSLRRSASARTADRAGASASVTPAVWPRAHGRGAHASSGAARDGQSTAPSDVPPDRTLELVALGKPRSAVAEAFRSIRTALAFSATNGSLRRVLVTSSLPKEGKTLVSANVAVTLAQSGKRVLLIDADLRKPRLHKVFQVPARPGLSNLLAGEGVSTTQDAIQRVAGVENLSFLPSGPIPPSPADLLGSERMRDLLDELGARFDIIVVDSPPALSVTDPVVLSQYVPGVLMVVRSFTTQCKLAQRAAELLGQAPSRPVGTAGQPDSPPVTTGPSGGSKIVGVVLNNVDVHRAGYYGYGRYDCQGYYYYYYGTDDSKPRTRRRHRAGSWYG